MSDTFCPLPWLQISIKPSGTMTTCCVMKAVIKEDRMETAKKLQQTITEMSKRNVPYNKLKNEFNDLYYVCGKDSMLDVLNAESLKKVRLDMLNGKKNEACTTCWKRERYSDGLISVRVRMGINWKDEIDINKAREITNSDGSINPSNIKQLELRLGNRCNLKCVTCHPGHSTYWYKDWKELSKRKVFWTEDGSDEYSFMFGGMLYEMDDKTPFLWYKSDKFKEDFEIIHRGLKEIYWAGGEPLLSNEHPYILKKLIHSEVAQKIRLRYDSNITYIPSTLINLWKHFKWVGVQSSVDDVGIRNDYIRYPSKWKNITKNLKKLDSINPHLCKSGTTLSCYNILTFLDFSRWAKENMSREFWENMHWKHVIAPFHLSPRILPKFIKQEAIRRIENFLISKESPPKDSLSYVKINMFKNFLIEELDFFNEEFYKGFIEHTINIDSFRNLSFNSCFPDLFSMIKEDFDDYKKDYSSTK